ncbi:MAG: CpaF family protein [Verrucomicrobiae bacterium]|nr:CpaF family protein [Verrucomicrobiae bacterium]
MQKNLYDYLILFFEPVAAFLKDEDVSEILINGARQIYVEKRGKLVHTDAVFSSEEALEAAAVNVARSVGRYLNKEVPILDARLPDGSRFHAVIPPVSRVGTVVSIRKFRKDMLDMKSLVEFGSISEEGAQLLSAIVRLHKNLIVSGATSSGKTTVLNVISGLIEPDQRIIVIEDSSELQLQQEHIVSFETREPDKHGKGEITIRDHLVSALRLRPDRLIIGEVRGGEALDLLQALNTGHSGSMSTIHANSAHDSLDRMETCALMSGIDIPLKALREQVAAAIHVVVQTARLSDGSRKVTAIAEVCGLKDGDYAVNDIYAYHIEHVADDGTISGHFGGTGYVPTFVKEAAMRRLPLDMSIFNKEKERTRS